MLSFVFVNFIFSIFLCDAVGSVGRMKNLTVVLLFIVVIKSTFGTIFNSLKVVLCVVLYFRNLFCCTLTFYAKKHLIA